MRFLHLLWANLNRKKIRTGLTLLSILVAFVLFGYLVAIRAALSMGVDVTGADRLVVRHRVSLIQPLPIRYLERMKGMPGVDHVVHLSWFGGIYQDPKNFFPQFPVDPEPYLEMFPEFILEPEEKKAWLETRTGVVVGRATAERFDWNVGDRVPLQATIWQRKDGSATWEFDIVGIYDGKEKGTDTTQFLFRYDYFDEARLFGEGIVGWYNVRVEDADRSAEVAEAIDTEFRNSAAETKTETEAAFAGAFAEQVGDIGTIVLGILGAVFFTILLVAGNTMAQAVRERREELAIFKAIGYTGRQVLGLVLAESCLLAILGGGLGLGLAWILIAQGDPTGGFLPIFFFPLNDLLIGIGIVAALGLVAGALPARQAMQLDIVTALRRM